MGAVLRVGRIGFINTLPVYGPLRQDPGLFEIVEGPPAMLNRMLAAGELDLASVSSLAYASWPEQLVILPGMCIASGGPVMSVRVFASGPPQQWEVVGLARESATSVAMLKFLLHRWGVRARVVAEDQLPKGAARLLIGDRALAELGRWPYELDVAQAWAEATGTVAVFGLWVVRRQVLERRREEVRAVHRRLVEALGRGLGRLEWWAWKAAKSSGLDVIVVRRYYRRLKWVMGEEELGGLRRLYRELAAARLLPSTPRLRVGV